ncbi:MAG: hypothetical protein ABJO05_20410, partial [Roseibium sp.]
MGRELVARLPESVQEIAEVIGRDKALEFIGKLPVSGSRSWRVCVYIPKRISFDHKLVELLGWQDACKMVYAFSGMILQPSNCRFIHRKHRDREIMRMLNEGMAINEIADRVELSTYRV